MARTARRQREVETMHQQNLRLRATLQKAHDWISPFTDPLNYTAAEMAKEIDTVLNSTFTATGEAMTTVNGEMVDAALLAYWGPRPDGRQRQWTVGERQGMRHALEVARRVSRGRVAEEIEGLRAALLAQEEADAANEGRVGYDKWQALEDKAKELRLAALGHQQQAGEKP